MQDPDRQLEREVEALIFASQEAISLQVIRQVTGRELDSRDLHAVVERLNEAYASSGRTFRIHALAGGYRFLSTEEFGDLLRRLEAPNVRRRLSRSVLEVLSVIAYHQPVTRSEMQQIRGVSPDYAIDRLLEREFIEVRGRADTPGKPLQYGTTKAFLDLFHLSSLKDLPKLREIKEILKEHEEQEALSRPDGEGSRPIDTAQDATATHHEEGQRS